MATTQVLFILLHLNSPVILTSQVIFGIFPVGGLRNRDSSRLSFRVKSICFAYSALIQCGIALMFTTSIFKQLNSQIEYTKVGKRLARLSINHETDSPFFQPSEVRFLLSQLPGLLQLHVGGKRLARVRFQLGKCRTKVNGASSHATSRYQTQAKDKKSFVHHYDSCLQYLTLSHFVLSRFI